MPLRASTLERRSSNLVLNPRPSAATSTSGSTRRCTRTHRETLKSGQMIQCDIISGHRPAVSLRQTSRTVLRCSMSVGRDELREKFPDVMVRVEGATDHSWGTLFGDPSKRPEVHAAFESGRRVSAVPPGAEPAAGAALIAELGMSCVMSRALR